MLATCRTPSRAEELQQVLSSAGQPAPFACDVARDESIAACLEAVAEHSTSLDMLINNAGVSTPGKKTRVTPSLAC